MMNLRSFAIGMRIDQWLVRLYAEDEALRAERERLAALSRLGLVPTLPSQGGGLQLLRSLRGRGTP